MRHPWDTSATADKFESFCEKILLVAVFLVGLGVAAGVGKIGPEMLTAWLIFIGSALTSLAAIGIYIISKKIDIRIIIGVTAFSLIYGVIVTLRTFFVS